MIKLFAKIREMRPTQKVFLAVITLIALIYFLEIYVLNTCLEPAEYVTTGNAELDLTIFTSNVDNVITFQPSQEKVECVRFALATIPTDTSETIELQILHGEEVLYRGLKACANLKKGEWNSFSTNLWLDTSETYEIRLSLTDTVEPQETAICGYYESDNQISPLISIGYAKKLRFRDKALTSVLVLLFYIGLSWLIIKGNSIRENLLSTVRKIALIKVKCPNIFTILWFPVTYLTLEMSELAIDIPLKIIISLLLFASAFWVENHWENAKVLLKSKKYVTVIILLSIWTAFSLVGSRCFVYPISMKVTVGAILLFAISILLFLPVILLVVMTSESFVNRFVKQDQSSIPWHFIIITLIMIFISMVYYLRAYNPAISSPDTNHCMYYAYNAIRGITDWHPAFYILWLKAIIRIVPMAEAVVVVQFAFFAYVMLRGFLLLYEKGMPLGILYATMFLTTLNCGNMVHLTTIWKDIPYTLSITWLTVLVAILLLSEKKHKVYIYLELAVALVWTCLFRQPGMIVFALVSICLLIRFWRNYKIWLSVIAAVAMVLIIKIPVYQYYEIQTDHGGGIYIGLGQDILGVYYKGGELSEDAVKMVEVLSKEDMANFDYSPYWAKSSYSLDVSKTEFIEAYLKTFIKNPVIMIRSLLCRMDAVWDIFIGENGTLGCVAYTSTEDGVLESDGTTWDEMWGERETNYITELISEWVTYSVQKPILNVLEWRSGIYFLAFVISIGICVCKKQFKNMLPLFVPCLAHVLSLVLSTGWSDFRYFWPINLMTLFVFTAILTLKPKEETK